MPYQYGSDSRPLFVVINCRFDGTLEKLKPPSIGALLVLSMYSLSFIFCDLLVVRTLPFAS